MESVTHIVCFSLPLSFVSPEIEKIYLHRVKHSHTFSVPWSPVRPSIEHLSRTYLHDGHSTAHNTHTYYVRTHLNYISATGHGKFYPVHTLPMFFLST